MIYHVYANRSNIGDWLSARGIQSFLGPVDVEDLLCDRPFVEDTMNVLSRATSTDLVIVGGGGLLMNYFEPFWSGLLGLANRPTFCLWGVGACDLKTEHTRLPERMGREIGLRSRATLVRDDLSARMLGRPSGAIIGICPSIGAIEPTDEEGFGLLHSASYVDAAPEVYETMRRVGEAFAERTGRPFRETNNRIRSDTRLEPTLDLYRRSDVILSARLHGCILGAALGKRVLAVSYDNKVESFMRAVGLEENVLDYRSLEPLEDRLEELTRRDSPALLRDKAKAAHSKFAVRVRGLTSRAA